MQRKAIIIILITLLFSILLGLFIKYDLDSKDHYSTAVQALSSPYIEKVGGKEVSHGGRGDGLIDYIKKCAFAIYCPAVHKDWIVQLEHGKENEAIQAILREGGYTPDTFSEEGCTSAQLNSTCSLASKKDSQFSKALIIRKKAETPLSTAEYEVKMQIEYYYWGKSN